MWKEACDMALLYLYLSAPSYKIVNEMRWSLKSEMLEPEEMTVARQKSGKHVSRQRIYTEE
jgi:hypothetical protein